MPLIRTRPPSTILQGGSEWWTLGCVIVRFHGSNQTTPPFVVISVLAISRKITSLEAAIVSSAEAGGKVLRLFPHELVLNLRSHILGPDLS